uniref:Uncharacterized protein n=1 Tax=Ixodes ricinus TaxID=34613 RepID=A0A6B0ULB1_IXORI
MLPQSLSLSTAPLTMTFCRSGWTPVSANSWALNTMGSSRVSTSTSENVSLPHLTFTLNIFVRLAWPLLQETGRTLYRWLSKLPSHVASANGRRMLSAVLRPEQLNRKYHCTGAR